MVEVWNPEQWLPKHCYIATSRRNTSLWQEVSICRNKPCEMLTRTTMNSGTEEHFWPIHHQITYNCCNVTGIYFWRSVLIFDIRSWHHGAEENIFTIEKKRHFWWEFTFLLEHFFLNKKISDKGEKKITVCFHYSILLPLKHKNKPPSYNFAIKPHKSL